MNCSLPTEVEIGGSSYPIRSDYRASLAIFDVFVELDLENDRTALAATDILYPALLTISGQTKREAAEKMLWFINCGDEGDNRRRPKLMDWEQD